MEAGTSPAIRRIPGDFMQHPYEILARLRADGPAQQVVMPHGAKVWLVTRYDDVRALLSDPRVSKDGRRMNEMFARHSASGGPAGDAPAHAGAGGDGGSGGDSEPASAGFDDELSAHMLNSDPPRHTRLRALVSKAFTARRMESLRPRVEEVVGELLGQLEGKSQFDLISAVAVPLPITIICDLFGIPFADREVFRMWAAKLVGAGQDPGEVAAASKHVVDYANALIDAKRANPGEDMVSALVQVSDDGDRLSRSELVAMIFLLVVAGHVTTIYSLGNGVYNLLTHPGELAKLRADPSLMPAAVDELMRYDSAAAVATFRFTTADIPVGGVTIPAGEILALSWSSANRDSAHFASPDELDVRRHPLGSLAFGHGLHYCIGAPLAKMQVEIGLTRLLARYPHLRLAVPPHELRWEDSTLLRGLTSLPVSVAGEDPP